MRLHQMLTMEFAGTYPAEAGAAIEQCVPLEVAAVLKILPPKTAAGLAQRMAPSAVARACEHCDAEVAAAILTLLSVENALPILRRMPLAQRTPVVDALPAKHGDAVRLVTSYPPGTAGALMDPSLLAFPSDLTVAAALAAVKHEARLVHYNLYITDRRQVLIGALNLQELLLAESDVRMDMIMKQPVQCLAGDADRLTILQHPGWRQVHSLPVVDGEGRFIGAIRYRTLRRLEAELRSGHSESEAVTVRALSDLFAAGMGGLLNALASALSPKTAGSADGVFGGLQPELGGDDGKEADGS